jgi:hypothetical protein
MCHCKHDEVLEMQEKVAAIANAHKPLAMSVATDTKACKQMWMERKEALWSAQAQYPDMECMITDVSITFKSIHKFSLAFTCNKYTSSCFMM